MGLRTVTAWHAEGLLQAHLGRFCHATLLHVQLVSLQAKSSSPFNDPEEQLQAVSDMAGGLAGMFVLVLARRIAAGI